MADWIGALQSIGGPAVAAYLAKDGVQKLLGPTADYLGEGLKNFTQKRAETVGRIFHSASEKLGDSLHEKGEVPPKVLRLIVNEGSYANDPLAVNYFGGLLASSRTEAGRDDRAARLAKIVDSLSTYQLRAHYLVYSAIHNEFREAGLRFNLDGRPAMRIFFPQSAFIDSMEFDESEHLALHRLFDHIFFGLSSEGLIGGWLMSDQEQLSKHFPAAPSAGMLIEPSTPGAELYLSALGLAQQPLEWIFKTNTPSLEGIQPLKGVMRTR